MTQTPVKKPASKTAPRDKSGSKMTYDRLKSMKKPATSSVTICLDSDLEKEFNDATSRREIAKMIAENRSEGESEKPVEELREAEAEYQRVRREVEKNSVRFVFRSIGRKRYDALVIEHPPTDEQRKKAEENGDDPNDLNWDTDKFPIALSRISVLEPEMTPEEFDEMWESDNWSGSELIAMFFAALQANTARGVVDLGKD